MTFFERLHSCVKKKFEPSSSSNTLFSHDKGPYYIETSPLIRSTNQWTGFYMMGTLIAKELISLG